MKSKIGLLLFAIALNISTPTVRAADISKNTDHLLSSQQSTSSAIEEMILSSTKAWKEMTPQELQITANMLFILSEASLVYVQTEYLLLLLQNRLHSIQERATHFQELAQELTTFKNIFYTFAPIAEKHICMHQILAKFDRYVDQSGAPRVHDALTTLRDFGRSMLCQYAREEISTVIIDTKNAVSTYHDLIENLNRAATQCQQLLSEENAVPIFDGKDEENELRLIESVCSIAQDVDTKCQSISKVTEIFGMRKIDLCRAAHLVYDTHYQSIYDFMESANIDPQFKTIMFDQNGILEKDNRTSELKRPCKSR